MRHLIGSMRLLIAAVLVGPLCAAAQGEAADADAELESMRRDLAKLKLDVDEAISDLRRLQADDADADAPAADAADDASLDAQIARRLAELAEQQQRLERQLDELLVTQRRLEARAGAPASSGRTEEPLNSPFDYRYQTTTTTTTRTVAPARRAEATEPPVDASYTLYANGYESRRYVRPTEPDRTVGPIVYTTTTPVVRHVYYPRYRRVVYTGHYRPYPHVIYHRPIFHRRVVYHRPARLNVGYRDGDFYFRFGTRVGYGGYWHHRRHH
jgi:hypothetical protein